ncbi:MAG: Ribonucleotide reductase of class II (Coenzyme B12-dependent) [Parcubacteria group bacterium GW2011_GWC1_41_7]|nr:MAG: Ribonucleotide reductase of class II (Coenzyme B12-dependent) [Parcubacteria group bacterium GW2011_GWC1_41_7]
MRGADAVAGSIKSGGATRRAAKMVLLNADHPDILEFIRVKADEELKVRAFIEAGYDLTDMNHPMWQNIFFQNANNSIRIGDDFMQAVLRDKEWHTKYRKTGEIAQTYKAKDLLWEAAKAAWECGDPGVQFDDTIQKWHTCKSSGKINATNPCAEYVFLDNTSCNLASINLMKYLKDDGSFDVKGFKHTAQVTFMAQDILIDRAGYPIESIGEETKKYRTIGLGYANLGSLLMALGIPYDSDEGRTWAASISALMLGEAYKTSSLLAEKNGVFSEYEKNKESALNVMKMHREKAYEINDAHAPKTILEEARHLWDEVVDITPVHGLRNAQAVVIAPTGTIGLAMDCDTTGIEPDFSLVKMKQLVGGGFMLFVNKTVPNALKRMGYSQEEIDDIIAHLERTKNIETAPHIKEEHIPVFDTAVKPADGTRSIHWMGHVKMVAAVQPFVSGAISKTFNMPSDATIQDIYDAYYESWKLGIKCLAVYRDNSKATQALFGAAKKDKTKKPQRRKLPDIRQSETHKFSIAGHEGYLTYSFFEDGTLGEIFIKMSKQGSTLAGLLDAFAIAISIALQYGVPLKDLVRKLSMMRFDPMGITNNSEIRFANSIIDYIFKYLAARFLQHGDLVSLGLAKHDVALQNQPKLFEAQVATARDEHIGSMGQPELSGPPCKGCGGMTIRTGSCYTCTECGESTGGCS